MEERIFVNITVFIGAGLAVIGWVIIQFIVIPLKRYKDVKFNIAELLTLYASSLSNPGSAVSSEASIAFKKARTTLETAVNRLPGYTIYSHLHLLPKRKQLEEVYSALTFISNGITVTDKLVVGQVIGKLEKRKSFIIGTLRIPQ